MSTTVLAPPQIIVEQRVVLHDVSWETYERLMKDHENRSVPRFTYDHGTLEIYMPTRPHEQTKAFFELLINQVAIERNLDVLSLGSTTYKREDLEQGVEPDCCFYFENLDLMRETDTLDLEIHPPPDLVVEIDVTSPSIEKFPIYAALGVPEIWRYHNEKLTVHRLRGNKYVQVAESVALRRVTGEILLRFLAESRTLRRPEWLGHIRDWVRSAQ